MPSWGRMQGADFLENGKNLSNASSKMRFKPKVCFLQDARPHGCRVARCLHFQRGDPMLGNQHFIFLRNTLGCSRSVFLYAYGVDIGHGFGVWRGSLSFCLGSLGGGGEGDTDPGERKALCPAKAYYCQARGSFRPGRKVQVLFLSFRAEEWFHWLLVEIMCKIKHCSLASGCPTVTRYMSKMRCGNFFSKQSKSPFRQD